MARKKEYIEEEVIEKAMDLFWRNGYNTTSIRQLEKEMGINQFSIYSSFGSKQGIFIRSIQCYKQKIKHLTDKLQNSQNGKEGIKQFFYDFAEFAKENEVDKGCLITNTANEFAENPDPAIFDELSKFSGYIKELFKNNLRSDSSKSEEVLERQANYLLVAKGAAAMASRTSSQKQLEDFIETTFENI